MPLDSVKLLITITYFTSISITNALDIIPAVPDELNRVKKFPGLGPIPGLDLPKIPCLDSVSSGATCVNDLISAVVSVKLGPIKSSCCEAVLKVEDSCWALVFPTNPLIPVVIKSICIWVRDHPPPPPPPSL